MAESPSGTTPEGEANPHPIPPAGGFSTPPDGSTYRDGYRAGLMRGYVEGREAEAEGEPMPEWATDLDQPPSNGHSAPEADGG